MKSLQESLFDDDLVQKDLPRFGDYYEPTTVRAVNLESMDYILSNFSIPKLKKVTKPMDISKIIYDKKEIEPLKYILAIIADLPWKEKFDTNRSLWGCGLVYELDIDNIFKDLARNYNSRRGATVWIDLEHTFGEGEACLRIIKSSLSKRDSILIGYIKK